MSKNEKPRVRFCWECGNKLRGNYFTEQMFEGHPRILHKQCWKFLQIGWRMPDKTEYEEYKPKETLKELNKIWRAM